MLETGHYVVRSLLGEGVLQEADITRATEHARTRSIEVIDAVVELGMLPGRRIAIERARICEYPFVDLGQYDIDYSNSKLLPKAAAERVLAFPLFVIGSAVTIGMVDPLNLAAIDQLRQLLKLDIEPVVCEAEQLRNLVSRAYGLSGTHDAGPAKAEQDEHNAVGIAEEPIVQAVVQILAGAVEAGASDIHISPDEHEVQLRYRVDGVLAPKQPPAKQAHSGIVQRLKVMAKLDLTQTRKPQDGKFRFTHRDRAVDVRLSVLPTIHGENVVMRLLRSASVIGSIRDLEMPQAMVGWFEQAINKPHGMILVTGPTGSGKTTTLFTALSQINTPDINIMTIEDPVEIRLPMVRQVQVVSEIGLTFASALRSILRQDPDVVLLGEIRDEETARIAVQAALTGHLLFSTLHTNNAVGAITRLRDLGVAPFAINNALLCVIAQRLLRRNCPSCQVLDEPDQGQLSRLRIDPMHHALLKKGAGCPECQGIGFKGRLAVYEMLRLTARVQRVVERGAGESEIVQQAALDGMRPLADDGVEKLLNGQTTIAEVASLLGDIDELPIQREAA